MRSSSRQALTVVPYSASYHDAVAELVLDIQQREFGLAATYEGQRDLQDPIAFFRHGGGDFWVALGAGDVVGCVGLLDFGERRGALRKMFVRAGWRGEERGVANALLDVLLDHARAHRFRGIWLDTHRSFRAAHRFYEKNGFRHIPQSEVPADFPAMSDDRFYCLPLGD